MASTTPNSIRAKWLSVRTSTSARDYVWQLPVRITHWVNAACLILLFLTGLYISHPVARAEWRSVPQLRDGTSAADPLHLRDDLHISFLVRIYWFWMGNHYSRSGFPYVWRPGVVEGSVPPGHRLSATRARTRPPRAQFPGGRGLYHVRDLSWDGARSSPEWPCIRRATPAAS